MTDSIPEIVDHAESIRRELAIIWAAHKAVGLDGYMALYTIEGQEPWRSQQEGICHWIGPDDIETAIEHINRYYNDGKLPNTTLLLNPIVHEKVGKNEYKPIGSGIFWGTALTLGVAKLQEDQKQRIDWLGVRNSVITRGDNPKSGLKMIGFSKEILKPAAEHPEHSVVSGCRDLYELTDIQSDHYWNFYMLSGLNYLCTHGMFNHPHINDVLPKDLLNASPEEIVKASQVDVQTSIDSNQCWNAYDRHHTLYVRFGQDPKDIPHNNRFYDLCARDLHLFDRTGPMRKVGSDETFEFVVNGLIPRGAVTLLAAAGGTGKSSIAHQLCVYAAIDWDEGEEKPKWLGQDINYDFCKSGICVYFSGEDGPAIINARGELFDPLHRANRLQFHRTEFQDKEITFSEYLTELQKMPEVPIVVIDPARKYLTGDENDADVVSEFFEAIEEFAIKKRSAMVVVHHLQKGARPTNSREVLDELRGSQVFIDRARVVIGMCRDEKHTIVGLAKNNIPPNLGMVTEERVFARNPKNLQLIWLPGEEGVRRDTLTPEEIEALEAEAFKRELEETQKGN